MVFAFEGGASVPEVNTVDGDSVEVLLEESSGGFLNGGATRMPGKCCNGGGYNVDKACMVKNEFLF